MESSARQTASYPENSPAHLSLIASRPDLRPRRWRQVSRGLLLGLIAGIGLGLGAFACSPGEDSTAQEESSPLDPPRGGFLGRSTISNWSGAVSHQSPTHALAELEGLMEAHGGETTYANASGSNGSLQGRVPHARFSAFRQAARDAGYELTSESRSTSDMRAELRRLSERTNLLTRAQSGLEAQRGGPVMDPAAKAILHELLLRERTSVGQQLDSYARQLSGVQINLSISQG